MSNNNYSCFFWQNINDILRVVKNMKVTVGVSNRHIHLTREVWNQLFGGINIVKRNDLGQPMQFATTSTVDIKYNGITIKNVRVIGPLRKYNQIEISLSDAKMLGVRPPRRQSGDLENSLPITIIGPKASVDLESGLILAERHIHVTPEMAFSLNLDDKEILSIYQGEKYLFDAKIKICNPASLELHIDTDEAAYYNLKTGMEVEVKICGK